MKLSAKMSEPRPALQFAPSKSDNPLWAYFEKRTTEEKARCKNCGSVLSCKGGSTGGLRGHMKAKHDVDVDLKIKPSSAIDASEAGAVKVC